MSDLGNKEVMAKNIKYYMSLHNKTRKQICSDLGFAYTTFSDWINGKKYPRIDKIEMMANYFNIAKSDLVESKDKQELASTYDNLYKLDKIKLPFLGKVACGEPIFADEIIFSQCETKKRLIPNNINSYWNDVTDLLLVEHLLSGTSYIYNALFSIRNIEIKMKNLSLFTDIFYIIFP